MGEENEKLKGKKHVKRGKKEKQVNVQQENNFLFPDSPALASWEEFLLVLVWVRERGPKDDLKDTQEETGGVCSQSLGSARAGSCVSAERLHCQVRKWWMYWGVGSGSHTQGWKGETPVKNAHV